jgi:hypothetical protein
MLHTTKARRPSEGPSKLKTRSGVLKGSSGSSSYGSGRGPGPCGGCGHAMRGHVT